jgi:hypothetical protein
MRVLNPVQAFPSCCTAWHVPDCTVSPNELFRAVHSRDAWFESRPGWKLTTFPSFCTGLPTEITVYHITFGHNHILSRPNILFTTWFHTGARGSVAVKALCYKPEDRGFETQWDELFSIYLILSAALCREGHSASNRNEYQRQRNNVCRE